MEDLGGHQLPGRPVGFRAVGDPLMALQLKARKAKRVKNERTLAVLIGLFIKACTFLKVSVPCCHDSIQVVTVQKGHSLNTSLNNTTYLHLNSEGH